MTHSRYKGPLAGTLVAKTSRPSSPIATCTTFPKSCCRSKRTIFIQLSIQRTLTGHLLVARHSAKCWWPNGEQNGHGSCPHGIYNLAWDINNPTNICSTKPCSYYERKYGVLWKNIIRGLNLYKEPFWLKDVAHIKHYLCGLFVNMKMLETIWTLNAYLIHKDLQ